MDKAVNTVSNTASSPVAETRHESGTDIHWRKHKSDNNRFAWSNNVYN